MLPPLNLLEEVSVSCVLHSDFLGEHDVDGHLSLPWAQKVRLFGLARNLGLA